MYLHGIFQWHKLLHFILPVIALVALQKRYGLARVSSVLFALGFLKEVYDTLVVGDSIKVSARDVVFNMIGIALGIGLAKVLSKLSWV